jgi:hypothetical protein
MAPIKPKIKDAMAAGPNDNGTNGMSYKCRLAVCEVRYQIPNQVDPATLTAGQLAKKGLVSIERCI